ncbi:corticospinal neuron axon guidance through spinal cord [Branchiostoma belcheri]|nr:corticospinal neuron axon guidance through spinal cord [Branchiostoma belcheri]
MGRKLRHVLIFLLIILKEPNMPEADCMCKPPLHCSCYGLNSIPQNLPKSVSLRSFLSIITIELDGNPWHCDCKMTPFRLNPALKDQIICAQPAKVQGQNLTDVNPEELTCEEPTDTSHYHWFFKRNAGPTACHAENTGKPKTTRSSPLPITDTPPSAPSPPLPVIIGSSASILVIVLICTIGLSVWYKIRHPTSLVLNPNVVGSNTNTAVSVMTSGHDQTGQGQSQAITESNTNTTATVMASDDDHQYEDIDKPRVKTGHCQTKAIAKSNTNTTATVIVSDDDHQYEDIDNPRVKKEQGHTKAIVKSTTKNTSAVMTSNDDHQYEDIDNPRVKTGQGQSQAITASNTNTTATVMASGHDQTEQGQSHTHIQSLKVGNLSHDQILAALNPNLMYVPTEVTSGHDQTGQASLRPSLNPTQTPQLL